MSECGTYGGYQRHIRQGETPCAACLKAAREYRKAYRASGAEDRERLKRRVRARQRAMTALARRHPEELEELFRRELWKELNG